jgi:hypothetical protein
MNDDPPEVNDVELTRQPPFVSVSKRPERKGDHVKAVILGVFIILVSALHLSTVAEPHVYAAAMTAALGGAIVGSALKEYALHDAAYAASADGE